MHGTFRSSYNKTCTRVRSQRAQLSDKHILGPPWCFSKLRVPEDGCMICRMRLNVSRILPNWTTKSNCRPGGHSWTPSHQLQRSSHPSGAAPGPASGSRSGRLPGLQLRLEASSVPIFWLAWWVDSHMSLHGVSKLTGKKVLA